AERGRKEHGREIRREIDVGPHMGESPARQRRNQQAGDRKREAQAERWRWHALPALAEFVDQLPHAQSGRDMRSTIERSSGILRMSSAQAKLALSGVGRNSACCAGHCRGAVSDRCPPFGVEGFENRDIRWAGWTDRSR